MRHSFHTLVATVRCAIAARAGARNLALAAALVVGALALELSSGCGVLDPVQDLTATLPPPVVGYVAGWEPHGDIRVEQLSAINYAFAHIGADGRVVLDQAHAYEDIARLVAMKQRNRHLQVLISIGGWGADGFSDAAASADSRSVFAQSVVELVDRTQADGVDIDWEYPGLPGPGIKYRQEDAENFTQLLRAVRDGLNALAPRRHTNYYLSAAMADGEFVAHIELQRAAQYLDWVNLMTYDFHNSLTATTGHHAALARSASSAPGERSVERAVAQFLAAGVPARKLVVGVPFYGRAFAAVDDANHGLDQPYGHYAGEIPWSKLKDDYIDRNGFVRYWDDMAHEPYLWNAQTREFVSYDDRQSLALKAAYVNAQHLHGMMYWEQSQDAQGELLNVLAVNLRRN